MFREKRNQGRVSQPTPSVRKSPSTLTQLSVNQNSRVQLNRKTAVKLQESSDWGQFADIEKAREELFDPLSANHNNGIQLNENTAAILQENADWGQFEDIENAREEHLDRDFYRLN